MDEIVLSIVTKWQGNLQYIKFKEFGQFLLYPSSRKNKPPSSCIDRNINNKIIDYVNVGCNAKLCQ
uniref:Uncharacterized protein n=1 Tax=Rhizophora mucronata TaxID=61149 RepID=A0A2P2NL31_RHIMU